MRTTTGLSAPPYLPAVVPGDDSVTPTTAQARRAMTMQAVHPTYRHRLIAIESAERIAQVSRAREARAAGYRQRPVRIATDGRRLLVAFGAAVTLPGLVSLLF